MALVWLAAAGCARPIRPAPPAVPPAPPAVPPPRPEVPVACERIERLELRKSERVLLVLCAGGARRSLPVSLGREPEGPKLRAGDQRTPEGEYRVAGPARPSRFHLFIPIDYPRRPDVERARREGVLSDAEYRELVQRLERGEPLPKDSPLGGDLGFHGEGERWRGDTPHLDWTYGCIALSDADIQFIAERIAIGTPVIVLP